MESRVRVANVILNYFGILTLVRFHHYIEICGLKTSRYGAAITRVTQCRDKCRIDRVKCID